MPPNPLDQYQLSIEPNIAGASGFEAAGAEIGIIINSNNFPYSDRFVTFRKQTEVLQYDLPEPIHPFANSGTLQMSLDAKIPTLISQDGAAAGIYAYLNLCEDNLPNHCICYGAGIADSRPSEQAAFFQMIFVDPDSHCHIVNSKLGLTNRYIDHHINSASFTTASFADYRRFIFSFNKEHLRLAVEEINRMLQGKAAYKDILTNDPNNYYLTQFVFNPELYVPKTTAKSSHPFAQIGLTIRNISVVLVE